MIRRLRKPLLWIIAAQMISWAVGLLLSRRMSEGDEQSDTFRAVAICGGKEIRSRAERLRSGRVAVTMGGIGLDLRGATLDPGGADLDVSATMGGVQITVPDDWAVELESTAVAGGVSSKVTPREELPDDAPTLRVRASVRMGGALVTTET